MNTLVLRRRLFYISAMVLLLVPLYFLGKPSVRRQDGSILDQGGTLAQLRTRYDLGQSDLGEMDPASESMRLATLGLRGVAASILWQKAEYYKKEQYWDRLSATLNQIAVLQPHFVKVWEFQAHNLSYNVSVEFDDYRQRYEWAKRGMGYLVKGSKYNKRRTELPYELGWFFGNKLGVADERVQFRELFRNDENFHAEMLDDSGVDFTQRVARGPDTKPDNWLVGNLWYQKAYDMVDAGSRPARSTMMFYRMGPQWRMKYAEAIQAEGILDYPARDAWERAGESWSGFGQRQIVTTYGTTIFLNELEVANQEIARLKGEFEAFCGVTFDRLKAEREDALSPEEVAALAKQETDRTFDELLLARESQNKLSIAPLDIARATPEDIRIEAIQKANQLIQVEEKTRHINSYREQINFSYWEARCVAEQQEAALAARTSMYEANELLDLGELDAALGKFEIAWENWSKLFNDYPGMMLDDAADDVLASITRYRKLLDTPELPEDFALKDFLKFREIHEEDLADPALMGLISSWPKRYPGRNFLTEMLRKAKDAAVPELPEDVPANPPRDAAVPATPSVTPAGDAAAPEVPAPEESLSENTLDAVNPSPTADKLEVAAPDPGAAPVPKVPESPVDTEVGDLPVNSPEDTAAPSPDR